MTRKQEWTLWAVFDMAVIGLCVYIEMWWLAAIYACLFFMALTRIVER